MIVPSRAVHEAVAADYADHVSPSLLAMAATLLALSGVRVDERVVDLACGTGMLTLPAAAAARTGGRVVGLDPNPAMLARARARVSPAAGSAQVLWVRSALESLPLRGASVDKVVCGAKLQHVTDVGRVLPEVRRVLRPGGRFTTCAWGSVAPDEAEQAVIRAFERHGLGRTCARRTELQVGAAVVDPGALPDLIEDAGLEVVHQTDGTVTLPFVDAAAYARWRLAFPRTVAALADRPDAARLREDVVAAVGAVLAHAPVVLNLPVHYTVSRRR